MGAHRTPPPSALGQLIDECKDDDVRAYTWRTWISSDTFRYAVWHRSFADIELRPATHTHTTFQNCQFPPSIRCVRQISSQIDLSARRKVTSTQLINIYVHDAYLCMCDVRSTCRKMCGPPLASLATWCAYMSVSVCVCVFVNTGCKPDCSWLCSREIWISKVSSRVLFYFVAFRFNFTTLALARTSHTYIHIALDFLFERRQLSNSLHITLKFAYSFFHSPSQ